MPSWMPLNTYANRLEVFDHWQEVMRLVYEKDPRMIAAVLHLCYALYNGQHALTIATVPDWLLVDMVDIDMLQRCQ